MNCPFCKIEELNIWEDGNLAFAIKDQHPVTDGHLLIIPRARRANYFELSNEKLTEVNRLLSACRNKILSQDATVEGFNIGANCGEVAGQTVFTVIFI